MRVALLLSVVLLVASCNESIESTHENYAAAAADGAIKKGRVPARVPPAAVDIVEIHYLDPGTVWGRFRNPGDSAEWLHGCEEVGGERRLRNGPRGVAWWDRQAVGDATAMRCEGEHGQTELFFLDSSSDRVFFHIR